MKAESNQSRNQSNQSRNKSNQSRTQSSLTNIEANQTRSLERINSKVSILIYRIIMTKLRNIIYIIYIILFIYVYIQSFCKYTTHATSVDQNLNRETAVSEKPADGHYTESIEQVRTPIVRFLIKQSIAAAHIHREAETRKQIHKQTNRHTSERSHNKVFIIRTIVLSTMHRRQTRHRPKPSPFVVHQLPRAYETFRELRKSENRKMRWGLLND